MSDETAISDRNEARYTRWGIVAAGGGGGRIASEFLFSDQSYGVGSRYAILNTQQTDIRGTIDEFERRASDVEERFRTHALEFGIREGAGNKFQNGRKRAEESIDDIITHIDGQAGGSQAFLYISTLGGGTGNGTVPYLIRQLSGDLPDRLHRGWMDRVRHVSLVVWPFLTESDHRQFNAVCGLSRHMMRPSGVQNADMTLLVSNEHLSRADSGDEADRIRDEGGAVADADGARPRGRRGRNGGGSGDGGSPNPAAVDTERGSLTGRDRVNRLVPPAVELMTAAGRDGDEIIDVEDYVSQPSDLGVFHFTFGLATDMHHTLGPEPLFDNASENTYAPLDLETCRAVFGVVRVPPSDLDDRSVTATSATAGLDAWRDLHGIDATGDATVVPRHDGKNTRDALLLLGGFDLDPLLDDRLDAYESHKRKIEERQTFQADSEIDVDFDAIEMNLRRYCRQNNSAPESGPFDGRSTGT